MTAEVVPLHRWDVPQLVWEDWTEEQRADHMDRLHEALDAHYEATRQPLDATSCTCLTWCGESSEAGCPDCVLRDIYDPCPAIGSGCGMGYEPDHPKTCDDDCCTPEQWAAAASDDQRWRAKRPAGEQP